MARTLAELRASKASSLPTRVVKICLDQDLLAQIQRLQAEKTDLLVSIQRTPPPAAVADEEREGPPRKAGERTPEPPPRVAEIDAELEQCWARMREAEGEVTLRAISGGAWQVWKDEHPPRVIGHEETARDGETVKGAPLTDPTDLELTGGWCNATALMNDLGMFAVAWNGEDFAPGDWDGWFVEKVAPADLAELVRTVVAMHQQRVTLPKAPSASSATPSSESASS